MMLRQLPQETVFMSNSTNSYVDPLHPERIYFTFPNNWSTNMNRHAIIGIRSIYVTRAFRRCLLTIRQTLKRKSTTETIDIETHDTTVSKFFKDDTLLQDYVAKINNELSKVTWTDTTAPNFKGTRSLECYYEFYKDGDRHRSRFVITSPYNSLPEDDRKIGEYYPDSGLEDDREIYYIEYSIVSINDDACIIFNYDTSGQRELDKPIVTYDIWDRDSCIVFSNLAYMSDHSFLGHTRRYELNSIKYYEINSTNQTFWVDLYCSVDHQCPVYLSKDNKDELYIEAVLLTSANAVL